MAMLSSRKIGNVDPKAEASDTITLLECGCYFLFVFSSDIAKFIYMINDEWKGRRVCQHVCDRRANCISEARPKCSKMLNPV